MWTFLSEFWVECSPKSPKWQPGRTQTKFFGCWWKLSNTLILYLPSLIKSRLFQVHVTYLNTGHWDWSPHKNPLFLVPDLMCHITIACKIEYKKGIRVQFPPKKDTVVKYPSRVNSSECRPFNIHSESPEMKKNSFLSLENRKGVGGAQHTIWHICEAPWISLYNCFFVVVFFHHQTLFFQLENMQKKSGFHAIFTKMSQH